MEWSDRSDVGRKAEENKDDDDDDMVVAVS